MEVISNSVPSGADSKGQGWAQFWDVQGAADYILRRRFTVVTLQFSDDLLREAKDVAKAVQDACASKGLQVKVIACIFYRGSAAFLAKERYHFQVINSRILRNLPSLTSGFCKPAGLCTSGHNIPQPGSGRGGCSACACTVRGEHPCFPIIPMRPSCQASFVPSSLSWQIVPHAFWTYIQRVRTM